jgi:hypothetical protein
MLISKIKDFLNPSQPEIIFLQSLAMGWKSIIFAENRPMIAPENCLEYAQSADIHSDRAVMVNLIII